MLNMTEIEIPENQKTTPWVRSLVFLIQGQAKIIQTQVEQIARLKTTVEELRDKTRLNAPNLDPQASLTRPIMAIKTPILGKQQEQLKMV
jgi:archaellum component FlaC